MVKFAPLSLVDPDNTSQFVLEWLWGRGQSVRVQLGYGGEGIGLWGTTAQGRFSSKETWRGRAEWRLYFSPKAVHRVYWVKRQRWNTSGADT